MLTYADVCRRMLTDATCMRQVVDELHQSAQEHAVELLRAYETAARLEAALSEQVIHTLADVSIRQHTLADVSIR